MDWLGVAALSVATIGGLNLLRQPRSTLSLSLGLAGFWAALILLAWRFFTVDLRLAEVASLSRDELAWPLRIAGVWAGSSGSFLLWSTIVVSVAVVAVGRTPTADEESPATWRTRRRLTGGVIAVAGLAAVFVARPFDRLAEPVVRGVGLNPVLEHWAMVVHPPLLYLAQASVLGAAVLEAAVVERAVVDRGRETARRWTLVATALLLAATLLGSWWAHDELGWGGFWAWDPVENTALAPLVALIASLHSRSPLTTRRWRRIAAAAVLAGIAVTRSGLPSSVHAFASGGVIAPLFGLAAAAVAVSAALVRRDADRPAESSEPDPTERSSGISAHRISEAVTSLGAAWVLVVIGSAAVAAMWLGTRDPVGMVDGGRLGVLLVPVGIATMVGLIFFGFRHRRRAAVLAAHLGVLLFGVGVIGTLFSTSAASGVRLGQPSIVNGHEVVLLGAKVDDSRTDATRADIEATVNGRALTASIVNYPDLERTRSRPARIVDLTGETELSVTMFDGEQALVELRRHPGIPFVWVGGALVVLALLASAARRDQVSSDAERRRSRFAASNDPSVEASPESELLSGSEPLSVPDLTGGLSDGDGAVSRGAASPDGLKRF